jgi:hypothetical protein
VIPRQSMTDVPCPHRFPSSAPSGSTSTFRASRRFCLLAQLRPSASYAPPRQSAFCVRLRTPAEFKGDHRVGHRANVVLAEMAALAANIERALADCDVTWTVPNAVMSPAEKLARVVSVGVAIFVYFLEIHPYANGNGHAARFLLARHGVFLRRWQMHPRPQDPPYSLAIAAYRNGDRDRGILERFVLSCL